MLLHHSDKIGFQRLMKVGLKLQIQYLSRDTEVEMSFHQLEEISACYCTILPILVIAGLIEKEVEPLVCHAG